MCHQIFKTEPSLIIIILSWIKRLVHCKEISLLGLAKLIIYNHYTVFGPKKKRRRYKPLITHQSIGLTSVFVCSDISNISKNYAKGDSKYTRYRQHGKIPPAIWKQEPFFNILEHVESKLRYFLLENLLRMYIIQILYLW